MIKFTNFIGYLLTALIFSLIIPFSSLNAYATTGSPPIAVNDSATTNQGIQIIIDILVNDKFASNTTVNIVKPPSNGVLSNPLLNSQNKVVYIPNASFSGTDSFTYTIKDDNGVSNVATVSITVNPVIFINSPPVAVPDSFTVPENPQSVQRLDVLANDHYPENNTITIESVGGAQHGSVQISNDHKFVIYTPFGMYFGPDSFTYTITDGYNHGVIGNVSINVTQISSPPAVNSLHIIPVQNSSTNIVPSRSNLNNDSIIFSNNTLSTQGNLNATSGKYLTYTPTLLTHTITGLDLNNNPMVAKILNEIEYSKKQVALIQKNQRDAALNDKLIAQKRLIAKQLQDQANQTLQSQTAQNSSDNAYNRFLSTVQDNNTKLVFHDEFAFTKQRVDAGHQAMKKILDNGGTYEEALQEFSKYAAIKRVEMVEMNKNLNIKYGLADPKVQAEFNSDGTLPENYIKVPAR